MVELPPPLPGAQYIYDRGWDMGHTGFLFGVNLFMSWISFLARERGNFGELNKLRFIDFFPSLFSCHLDIL